MAHRPVPTAALETCRALAIELGDVQDPAAIAQMSQEALTMLEEVRNWLVSERLDAITTLRQPPEPGKSGMSLSQLATLMNVSKSRAQQLVDLTKKDPVIKAPHHGSFSKSGEKVDDKNVASVVESDSTAKPPAKRRRVATGVAAAGFAAIEVAAQLFESTTTPIV